MSTELEKAYLEAYETSLSPMSGGIPTLGRGFQESDPTGQTATNAQLRQLRWRASKAAGSIRRALRAGEDALAQIGHGFNTLDDAEWGRFVAKRLAAEAERPPG